MPYQLAALIHIVFAVIYYTLQRKIAFSKPELIKATNSVQSILIAIAGFLIVNIFTEVNYNVEFKYYALMFLISTIYGFGTGIAFKLNSQLDAAQFALIRNTTFIVAIIGSTIFLGDELTSLGIFGTLLIIAGVVTIIWVDATAESKKVSKYSYALMAVSVFFAIANVTQAYVLKNTSVSLNMSVVWPMGALWSAIYAGRQLKHIPKLLTKQTFARTLSISVALFGLAFFSTYAYSIGNASVVAALISFRTAAVIMASVYILKEKTHIKQKTIAVGIATTGLLLAAI